MKKIGKMLTCVLLALVTPFCMVACGGGKGSGGGGGGGGGGTSSGLVKNWENDFDYIPHYEIPQIEPDIDFAIDEGDLKPFRMEEESAVFAGLTKEGAYSDLGYLGFDLRLSGSLATRNMNTTDGATKTYKFTSDKSVNVELKISVQGNSSGTVGDENNTGDAYNPFLKDMVSIRNNDKGIKIADDIQIKYSECTLLGHNDYMRFKEVSLRVNIKEGENELVVSHLSTNGGNFDYIELITSANITGWDPNHYTKGDPADVWTMVTKPTISSTGILKNTATAGAKPGNRDYILPNLASGLYTKTGDTYSFKVKDEVFEITPGVVQQYTLTLDPNADVSFAGGSKSMELTEGASLPTGITTPNGKTLAGWYQHGAEATKWAGNTFIMPSGNVTISPYYTSTLALFKPKADAFGQQYTEDIGEAAGTDTLSSTKADGFSNGYDGEIFAFFCPAGARFRFLTTFGNQTNTSDPGNIQANKQYTFTYHLENKGSQKIQFIVRQLVGGSAISNINVVATSTTITLVPGARITITLQNNKSLGANANGVTSLQFLTTSTNANKVMLAISLSYEKGGDL